LGLEILFDQWWADDPDRSRLLSCVLVDMDRVAKLNERFGASGGDNTIAACGKLLKELVRQERGVDRVARFSGQSFMLFLGDTDESNAVGGAERIRQTVEATSFEIDQERLEVTVSCAAAEIGSDETLAGFLQRLQNAIKEAKKAGRNQTALTKGKTIELVEPPTFRVTGRTIEIVDTF
jgi:diguanylate cyclase (GGDEF)-like protein